MTPETLRGEDEMPTPPSRGDGVLTPESAGVDTSERKGRPFTEASEAGFNEKEKIVEEEHEWKIKKLEEIATKAFKAKIDIVFVDQTLTHLSAKSEEQRSKREVQLIELFSAILDKKRQLDDDKKRQLEDISNARQKFRLQEINEV
jgi:hypothetical protein